MGEAGLCNTPWTEDQLNSLNGFQACEYFHPFTCGQREPDNKPHVLFATKDGWTCPMCNPNLVCQTWCHEFMADWSWKKSEAESAKLCSDPRVSKLRQVLEDIAEKE
jgi:hypothetical protein